jgi:hypothetical protein
MISKQVFVLAAVALVIGCHSAPQDTQLQSPSKAQPSAKPIEPQTEASNVTPPASVTGGSSVEQNTQPTPGIGEVEITYTWEGGSNRCNSATAKTKGVIVGTAKKTGVGGDQQSGYFVEVEEVQYSLDGSHDVIYRGKLKFRIGISGEKIEDTPVYGEKRYELFRRWPMGN